MKSIFCLPVLLFVPLLSFSLEFMAPSLYFDFKGWKLQIPGPIDITNINGYASRYFFLTAPDNSICFQLDAGEQGHTKNSEFVRSELRHYLDWSGLENHELTAEVQVTCDRVKYEVTVAQIHGITASGENAPPLLRVAMVDGGLYAFMKTDPAGERTERIPLVSGISTNYFRVDVKNDNNKLKILVNGKDCLERDISYWKFMNYFKLGCYPQAHIGIFRIYVKSFTAR